jgi:hypothetical protein
MAVSHSLVSCKDCGAPLSDASPSDSIENRKPCPQCGSTSRAYGILIEEQVSLQGSLGVVHVHHSERLLETARDLFQADQYGLAVVVAHSAYEVGVERAVSQTLRAQGLDHLEDAIDGLLGNFNLGNGRVHKFFTALTGETVTDKPFWRGLEESVKRRNQIVHRGLEVTQAEAQASLQVAGDVVVWLKTRFS